MNEEELNMNDSSEEEIIIKREILDFDTLKLKHVVLPENQHSLHKRFRYFINNYWSKWSFWAMILSFFPILNWLPKYSVKNDLIPDAIAGFTISILHIPQGIAYSILAGVHPIHGLYVSFFPVLIYSLMGTSKHISIGTFAVASIMLNNAAEKLNSVTYRNITDVSAFESASDYLWPPTFLEVLTSICLLSGLIQFSMGIFKLGILSVILSDHLVSSFTTAVAFHVATSQLNNILGLEITNQIGLFKLINVNTLLLIKILLINLLKLI